MPTNNAWNSTNPAGVVSGGTGLATLTAHNLLVGEGTSPVNLVAPSATSGVPVISQGSSSDPVYGTAVVAGGGTGSTSFTAYSVICGGTSSTAALTNVSGLGTASQVLTSNGAAALPTWQNPPSGTGALVLLQTQTVSNVASVAFTSGFSNSYNNYLLVTSNVYWSSQPNPRHLYLQISTNGGSSYISSNYLCAECDALYNSPSTVGGNSSTTGFSLGYLQLATLLGLESSVWLKNFRSNSGYPATTGTFSGVDASQVVLGFVGGCYNSGSSSAVVVNAINIFFTGVNLSGTFSLYGLAQ